MNRGAANSRVKYQYSWRPKSTDSSPNHQTPAYVRNLRFNLSATPKPLVIVAALDKSHVQATVVCAKEIGLEIRIRSGGHDFEGGTLGELYYNIANKSNTLAFPAGVCTTVGVGGHFSGGEYGPMLKKFGSTVQVDVSSGGSVSSTSDEKSHSSGQAARHNSGGRIQHSVTPAGRQGRGWSTFGSGKISRGGSARQSTTSSKAGNASDFSRNEQFGLKSGQLSSGVKDVKKLSSGTVKGLGEGGSDCSAVNLDCAFMESLVHCPDVAQLSGDSVPVKSCFEAKIPESADILRENENSECSIPKFDLCQPRDSSLVTLKPSLMSKNREKRKEKERSTIKLKGDILRSGMVLLKNYLSISEQANIFEICRHHGLGPMGFYQPSFGEGGKMHLKLMCFGAFWNPETNQYREVRQVDPAKAPAKAPPVPHKFLELVDRAIKDSQSLISENSRVKDVESILPSVKPDICLVNYYCPKTGCLGLHQDKDESQKSLDKGIPIVSFSIGDSAEFLYSDQRDAEKADKVILESGDVLIFGRKSRHIFHGVRKIISDTAPKPLLEETNFRPGRLNLTFRQRF